MKLIGRARLQTGANLTHNLCPSRGTLTPKSVELKLPQILKKYASNGFKKRNAFLQPITIDSFESIERQIIPKRWAILFHSVQSHYLPPPMPVANFINLSTATQSARKKEYSIKKIFLSEQPQNLVGYFFLETLVICPTALGFDSLPPYRSYLFQSNTGKRCNYFQATWLIFSLNAHFYPSDCNHCQHLTSLAGYSVRSSI